MSRKKTPHTQRNSQGPRTNAWQSNHRRPVHGTETLVPLKTLSSSSSPSPSSPNLIHHRGRDVSRVYHSVRHHLASRDIGRRRRQGERRRRSVLQGRSHPETKSVGGHRATRPPSLRPQHDGRSTGDHGPREMLLSPTFLPRHEQREGFVYCLLHHGARAKAKTVPPRRRRSPAAPTRYQPPPTRRERGQPSS